MISDLDESIRAILLHAGQIDPAEIDISFELPKREWSAGISRPTVNCYLFDIRENLELRDEGWEFERRGGGTVRRYPPLRFDLTYLITAWTRAIEDEHRLLWHLLQTLVRFPVLPAEYAQGALRQHPLPLYTRTSRPNGETLRSPGEFWSALENLLKPSLSYVVTIALDREAIAAGPPVLTPRLRFQQPDASAEELLTIVGTLRDQAGAPVAGAAIELDARGVATHTDAEGRFRLARVAPGPHSLAAHAGPHSARRELIVPAPDYDITIDRSA